MSGRLILSVYVPGLPRPQGSMKLFRAPAGHEVAKYSDPVYSWRRTVTAAVLASTAGQFPTSDAVALGVTFGLPRPRGHYGTGRNVERVKGSAPCHPKVAPDLDKLLRAVSDSITDAGTVWHDDAQVVELVASKRFGPAGATVRVTVLA